MLSEVVIYTDGACRNNPGPGGWGCVLLAGDYIKELCGGELDTTNNRMELLATIKALEGLKRKCRVVLYTDSVYVQKGITQWIFAWKKNGWKNSQKKPVVNADLWQRLDDVSAQHHIDWQWIKGHAGHKWNERADELARKGLEEAL